MKEGWLEYFVVQLSYSNWKQRWRRRPKSWTFWTESGAAKPSQGTSKTFFGNWPTILKNTPMHFIQGAPGSPDGHFARLGENSGLSRHREWFRRKGKSGCSSHQSTKKIFKFMLDLLTFRNIFLNWWLPTSLTWWKHLLEIDFHKMQFPRPENVQAFLLKNFCMGENLSKLETRKKHSGSSRIIHTTKLLEQTSMSE